MPQTDTAHSKVLFTWVENGERVGVEGLVPDIIAKKADHRPQCLVQELTHEDRLGIDLAEVEPVEAVVIFDVVRFTLRLETDEDGEPTAHHSGEDVN